MIRAVDQNHIDGSTAERTGCRESAEARTYITTLVRGIFAGNLFSRDRIHVKDSISDANEFLVNELFDAEV
jgi:hypothetical protein